MNDRGGKKPMETPPMVFDASTITPLGFKTGERQKAEDLDFILRGVLKHQLEYMPADGASINLIGPCETKNSLTPADFADLILKHLEDHQD